MVKKTTLQRALKSNCDPRKYGDGVLSDISKVNRMIARARYNRYNTMKKEGTGFDKMAAHNIKTHPPVRKMRTPPPGFKAVVKKFMDAVIYNVGGLTRDLWPDGTTTLQNYLAMLSDWLQDRGLRYGAYGLAAATIALIARDIYSNGSDAWEIRAIRRAYEMSGLGRFVQYTSA